MAKKLILFLLVLQSTYAMCQVDLIENEEAGEANAQTAELMEHLKQHPIDLNLLQTSSLSVLPYPTDSIAAKIIQHRQRFGDFVDVLELQQCGLSYSQIQFILPYVKVTNPGQNTTQKQLNHTVVMTILSGTNHNNLLSETTNHTGNNLTTVFRYRGKLTPRLSVSFTAEKDAGEAYFGTSNWKPFDFNSGNVTYRLIKKNATIIVGDFICDFGQGLTVGSGMRVGKSAQAVQTSRVSFGVKPYRSVTEFGFKRGCAFQMTKPKTTLSFWLHNHAVDASTTEEFGMKTFRSFQQTGFHRTQSEMANKATIQTREIGVHHTRVFNFGQIGYTGVIAQHDGYKALSGRVYQQFAYTGRHYYKHGLCYRLNLTTGYLFGETTLTSNKSAATVHGILVGLGKSISLTSVFRRIMPGFISMGSKAFAESSTLNNENGIYFGLQFRKSSKTNITAYVDHYWFPWLRSSTVTASHGVDYSIRFTSKPSKQLSWHVQLKYEQKTNHETQGEATKLLTENGLLKIRLHISRSISKQIRLQTRLAINQAFEFDTSYNGAMLYQDIQYKLASSKATFYLRFATANIDDYSTRVYTYENDLAYRFSLPAYTYNQLRSYFLVRWKFTTQMDFWLKYILTSKTGVNDLDSVSSPNLSKFHIQLRIKL